MRDGIVYVFTRSADVWTEQTLLNPSNVSSQDFFGGSVAIEGDTLVVTASIGIYIYTRNAGIWTQQSLLDRSNIEEGSEFWPPISVDLDGDTLVAGARGTAYVFTRNAGVWRQQGNLKASNADYDDRFGCSVAISGNTVIVGAEEEDSNATTVNGDQSDNSASDAGAAYVFTRNAGIWSQQAYLKASNADGDRGLILDSGDLFGNSVAIAGNTVVVGTYSEDSDTRVVNGDQSNNSAFNAGAAYIFTRNAQTWIQQDYLKASNADIYDSFGSSVAISGATVVVGASIEDSKTKTINGDQSDNSANNAGAAYVFNLATPATAKCNLNMDGNASIDALTDGILLMRYLFGSRGGSLTMDAVATDCTRCSATELEPILEQYATASTSDIDGNGEVDALTDGLLMIRYLSGIRGDALIEGSVANNCTRCNAIEIETYIPGIIAITIK